MEKEERFTADSFCKIALAQALCVAAIILALLVIKEFFPDEFGETQKFYESAFLAETEVSEVLSNADEI